MDDARLVWAITGGVSLVYEVFNYEDENTVLLSLTPQTVAEGVCAFRVEMFADAFNKWTYVSFSGFQTDGENQFVVTVDTNPKPDPC